MADITSTILAIFKADTKPYKRAVKDLKGEQKKLAKAQLDSLEKQNDGIEDQIAKWGKVAVGVGAVVGAYATLSASAKRFAEQSRLESAAVGKDIEAIQKAGQGLVTEFQALELAAKTANSQFAATQQEMEEATKFAVLLAERGMGPLEKTLEEVTKALVEGNVEGLKQFGIMIDSQSDTLEGFEAIMSRIRQENEGAGEAIANAGTATEKAGVRWQNTLDNLVVNLGRVADKLAPIVDLVNDLVEGLARALGTDFRVSAASKLKGLEANRARELRRAESPSILVRNVARKRIAELDNQIAAQRILAAREEAANKSRAEAEARRERIARQRRSALDVGPVGPGASLPEPPPGGGARGGGGGLGGGPITVGAPGFGPSGTGPELSFPVGTVPGGVANTSLASLLAAGEGGLASVLSGDLAEKISPLTGIVGALTESFGGLQAAAGSAFASMILGTESFGGAFKRAMGEVLTGLVTQLSGIAIVEGVQALVSLASLDFRGAAQHGKAAAAAAAGAVAVGVLARGLGVNNPGGAGAGALPSGAAGGGSGRSEGSSVTVFVGSDFAENPRAHSQKVARQFRRARQLNEGEDTVLFS